MIQVEAEQMTVLANDGVNLTVQRGANGTTNVMHSHDIGVNPAYDQRDSNYPRALSGVLDAANLIPDIGAVEFLPPPTITVPPGGITIRVDGGTLDLCSLVAPIDPSGGLSPGPGSFRNTFTFDPSLVGPGVYTITYSYQIGDTTASVTFTITVTGLPGPLIVKNTNDDGTDSLRRCVRDIEDGGTVQFSNTTTGGATNFSAGNHTITLTTGQIVVGRAMTIQGPGSNARRTFGGNTSRIFWFVDQIDVNVDGLTVSDGKAVPEPATGSAAGGAFYLGSADTLTLTNSTISNNSADSGADNQAYGGALYAGDYNTDDDVVTLTNCTVSNNMVTGSYCAGGAIYAYAPLTLNGCTVSNNTSNGGANGGESGAVETGASDYRVPRFRCSM